jgi:hypothetical protein
MTAYVVPLGYIKVAKCEKTVENGCMGANSWVSAPI